MTRINQTLLTKLFADPTPQPKRKEVLMYFNRLHSRMFPDSDEFIEFLSAQSIDRQYESAERIIQRLCYCSNFPPSYYALMDVVCVEHYQKSGISDAHGHIPRDHFLHLVFLYLLGIYVFFYDAEFYSKIVDCNRFERDSTSLGNIEFSCIKDFISEWKYFCLFHDVGYTPEILGNKSYRTKKEKAEIQKTLKSSSGGYKASFEKNETLKQITYWGTIEILSKLIFSWIVITNSEELVSPEHKVFKRFQRQKLLHYHEDVSPITPFEFNEFPPDCITGRFLDRRVCSNQCLKQLFPVFGIDSISVIGIDKESGQLSFVFFTGKDGHREFVFTEQAGSEAELNSFFSSPKMILFDDYLPVHYEFKYILTGDDGRFNDYLKMLGITDYFPSVCSQLNEVFGCAYKEIRCEEQFLDFSFVLFSWLCRQIDRSYYDTPLEGYLDKQKFSFDKYDQESITSELSKRHAIISQRILNSIRKYKDELRDICNSLLSQEIKKLLDPVCDFSSLEEMIEKHTSNYFSCVAKISNDVRKKTIFKEQLEQTIREKIQEEIDVMELFSHLYVQVKSTLSKSESWFEYDFIESTVKKPQFLEACISKKLRSQMGMSIEEVEKEYELRHGITVDHGIASACYTASIFYCYRCALEEAKTPQERLLLSILLDIPGRIEDSRVNYISDYDHVFTSVLYAIFTHNLYPSHFMEESKGRKYKTKMTDPFSYLALLCDSLQDWNRPKNLHPAWMDSAPIMKASEEFNIEVSESGIIISDSATKSSDWIGQNINGLSDFLYSINAYLKKA